MKARPLLCCAVLLATRTSLLADDKIGFVEKFALAPDREAVLAQLIPGSEEYYFYSALHYQNTRQAEKLAAIMEPWAKRFPNSAQRREIENREALLTYDANPQATLKFLRDRLNLQFNHQVEARDRKPDLPTTLDQARIARSVFQKEALAISDDLKSLSVPALEALVRDKAPLKPAQVRSLLARLERPDVANLTELILADLKNPESRGFGEFPIHKALLPEQLDELAGRQPALFDAPAFVFARLRKLAPGADTDAEYDLAEREAWLDRAYAFASKLSPAFNSLKANLLYQRLELDRQRGLYDSARFLAYLKLPRRSAYAVPLTRGGEEVIDFNAAFTEAVLIAPPIRRDDDLVRDYFLHLFGQQKPGASLDVETLLKPWIGLVKETWLRPILAEAMITAGLGNPEQWASLLTPSAFQALKERVDVDFARTNPRFLLPADDVSLDLFLKNSPKLIVKIYEINALSYFLTNGRELNTDLPLDGLVANRETTHDFSTEPAGRSPFARTRRTFSFPELKGKRGAWVIEFIGGGKSSRALVRKGQWSILQQPGPAGDLVTVLDEEARPVTDAAVWLQGRRYAPDAKSGRISIPFSPESRSKSLIISDATGEFATLAAFEHHPEAYRLEGGFHVEREQLLPGKEATLAVRLNLLAQDIPLPLELLSQAKLTLTTTTLDGVSTQAETPITGLQNAREWLHRFTVPDRLATLSATVTAKVENLSQGGEKQDVSATKSWSLNGIAKTAEVAVGHLAKFGGQFAYELFGRNGEPLPDRQVVFEFRHHDFERPQTIALKTDERGRIVLGALAGLETIQAEASGTQKRAWSLQDWDYTWPFTIHALAGEPVLVAIPPQGLGENPRERISLLEERAQTFVADRRAAVTAGASFLAIKDLAPGDYTLRVNDGEPHAIRLRIAKGKPVQNWIVAPHRRLEIDRPAPLQITGAAADAQGLTVQLANINRATRVHVTATRFLPTARLFDLGSPARRSPLWATPDKRPNLFAAGREIGDEYRYILDRRYARLFPGNMLARPGLILNPWEVRSTDLQAQNMAAAQQLARAAGDRGGAMGQDGVPKAALKRFAEIGTGSQEDLNFLAEAAPVSFNLIPDARGTVHLDRAALGDRSLVQIMAEDESNVVWQQLSLPETATKFRDARLIRNLDPEKAFTEKKETTVLRAAETLTLANLLTSDLETYDSLPSVHSLLSTLNAGANLGKFEWLMRWPALPDEEKRAKYSEFACHELSYFLSRKDPAFFQSVVLPHLRNKKDRTFVDEFLVGADLRRWLEPWSYAQLNAFERCLLAQRQPGEAAATARHLREKWELSPPDYSRLDDLFETALRGRGLDESEGRDVNRARRELQSAALALEPAPAAASASAPKSTPMPESMPAVLSKAKRQMPMSPVAMAAASEALLDANADRPAEALGERGGEDKKRSAAEKAVQNFSLAFMADEAKALRDVVRPFFRALGPTKEWAENNYYHLLLSQQTADLIRVNAFWRDFAAWDGKSPFLSEHFIEAHGSLTESLLALAVLDLPFVSPKHETRSEGNAYTLKAAGPMVAFHREIKPAAAAKEVAELLVSQNYFRQGQRYREEGNERFDLYVSDEFLAGEVYGANVVVTNPTSTPQKLELLLQIPRGAIPVLGSKETDSRRLRLGAYTTQTFEYFFYFPLPAEQAFPQYPVHVSHEQNQAGAAKPFTFHVVRQLSQIDKKSWNYLSQYGTEEDVFAFLQNNNIERLDLNLVAWRARQSAGFFRQILTVLAQRHYYNDTLESYAVVHNDAAALREWLRHQDDFLRRCGPYLKAGLLTIDPIERRSYEHLEYSPLVNQRVHRLGAEPRIANPVFREQYQNLLNILAHKPALEAMDEMSVVYYLFLQDRVEEALARFHGIKPDSLPTRLQYDYFRCSAAFYEEKLDDAKQVVAQYQKYPVDRWQKLFAEVGSQLAEIAGAAADRPGQKPDEAPNRELQQGELAATEPSFEFQVENRKITLSWRNLAEVSVHYYLMEPEFLFSSSPFVSGDATRFSIIKPTKSATVKLPAGQDAMEIPLPPEFTKANVLIEILGAGQRHAQAYHANTFKLNVVENYGRLEVRDQAEGKPVAKAYVKVYARLQNGTVRFFKDGYTDLRGKFDYASLNSSDHPNDVPTPAGKTDEAMNHQMLKPEELNQVEKLAVLIMHDAHGALVREVVPPAR